MKIIHLPLEDRTAQQLEQRARALGLTMEAFLSQVVDQHTDQLLRPKRWMPADRWVAMYTGKDCPECEHLKTGANPSGYPIAELGVSRLDLMRNQSAPGMCALYFYRHTTELYDLDEDESAWFMCDMMTASQALAEVFEPTKMNYQILGNQSPHLHCILQPRYYGDSEPGWPIDPYKEQVLLPEQAYQERVCQIREALERIGSTLIGIR